MQNRLLYKDTFDEKYLDVFHNANNGVSFFIRNEDGSTIEFVCVDLISCAFIHNELGQILKINENG
jgi:hypothetical protein